MKTKILTLFLTLGILVFTSCENNDNNTLVQIPNGKYTGIITVEYANGNTFSYPVTVGFMEENFYTITDDFDYYPTGGNGTFEINCTTIDFKDINPWIANFDWNLILNGQYDYSLNGNELLISAYKNNVAFYKYELKKE